MAECERCDTELKQGEVTLCGECQEAVNKPTEQPADALYDLCPICDGSGRNPNPALFLDACPMCKDKLFTPVGLRRGQVEMFRKAYESNTEIANLLRANGIAPGSTLSMVKVAVTQLNEAATARGKSMTQILFLEGVVWKLARQVDEFACGADAFEDYTDSERQLILAMLGNAEDAA